jgi:hypothetical protein
VSGNPAKFTPVFSQFTVSASVLASGSEVEHDSLPRPPNVGIARAFGHPRFFSNTDRYTGRRRFESAIKEARTKVVARLYNTAQVPAATRDNALAVATRTLAHGVDIVWRSCDHTQACGAVLTTGELVIRLVRTRTGKDNSAVFALGQALIDIGASAGVFATVCTSRSISEISAIRSTRLWREERSRRSSA